jgi:hypothetical protein
VQAEWRTDPARSGPAGCLSDIGTHAYNLAAFVIGLQCQELAADLSIFMPGRRLDDNVHVMLRYSEGARGMLWASQVAPGNENNLRLRLFGEQAALEWHQEDPNYLTFTPFGEPPRLIRRNGAGARPVAGRASRIPAGHPEGYLEALPSSTVTSPSRSRQASKSVPPIRRRCWYPVSPTASPVCVSLRACSNLRGAMPAGSGSLDHTDGRGRLHAMHRLCIIMVA